MSDRSNTKGAARSSEAQKDNGKDGQGNGQKPAKQYKFSVDGRHLETEQQRLTGLQIKSMATVDASFGLFLEGRGNGPDRQIGDGEAVDFALPGNETFYVAPPATYGARGHVGRAAARSLARPDCSAVVRLAWAR